MLDRMLDHLRAAASSLQDNRRSPPQVQRHQRPEQMLAMDHLLVIRDGKVVDGLNPQCEWKAEVLIIFQTQREDTSQGLRRQNDLPIGSKSLKPCRNPFIIRSTWMGADSTSGSIGLPTSGTGLEPGGFSHTS